MIIRCPERKSASSPETQIRRARMDQKAHLRKTGPCTEPTSSLRATKRWWHQERRLNMSLGHPRSIHRETTTTTPSSPKSAEVIEGASRSSTDDMPLLCWPSSPVFSTTTRWLRRPFKTRFSPSGTAHDSTDDHESVPGWSPLRSVKPDQNVDGDWRLGIRLETSSRMTRRLKTPPWPVSMSSDWSRTSLN